MLTFPELLTQGVLAINAKTLKPIETIQDELGIAIDRKASTIAKWRNVNNENRPNAAQTEILAREIIRHSNLGPEWLEDFIAASSFPDLRPRLMEELFPDAAHGQPPLPDVDWATLQQACQSIQTRAMVNGRRKYDRSLYLQRHEATTVLKAFLQSKQQILIITGKSGVGKSSLLHALLDKERSAECPVCLLGYDSHYLEPTEPLEEQIQRDFERWGDIPQIWRVFDRFQLGPDPPPKQVVLLIDALNEHQQPMELLQNIDRAMRRLNTPWLKTVITSRPEAWRQIYRQAKLSAETFYYRQQPEQAEPGFGLPEFQAVIDDPVALSYPLPAFHVSELAQVYEKYRQNYQVKTPFEALTPAVKEAIRDPLFLSFMALMYRSKAIPEIVQPHRIYQSYLDFLIKDGQITYDDERFLHNEFIQLMDTPQGYRNEVLFERFRQYCFCQLDKEPDKSLKNLIDANILIRRSHDQNDQEDTLQFTIERFYDHFMGQHLWHQCETDANPLSFIESLSDQLVQAPFLWGAMLTMLRELFNHGDPHVFEQLGVRNNESLLQLLMALLTEQYAHHSTRIEQLLQQWLNQTAAKGSQTLRLVAHIAINCGIAETLNQLLSHPNKTVRNLVVQDIYSLWQQSPTLTQQILTNLAKHISPQSLINITQLINTLKSPDLFMTFVDASFLLFLSEYSSKTSINSPTMLPQKPETPIQTPAMLQQIWHPLLRQYLLINAPIPNILMQQGRYWAMFFLFRHKAVSYIKHGQRERFSFDFVSTQQFYPPTPARQQMVQRLTAHMDASIKAAPEPIEALTDFIVTLVEQGEDNFWVIYLAQLSVLSHLKATPIETAQAVARLLKRIASLHPPTKDASGRPTAPVWYPMISHLFFGLSYQDYAAMPRQQAKAILLTFIEALKHRVYEYGDRWRREFGDILTLDCLEPLLFGYALQIPEAGPRMLEALIDFYVKEKDYDRIAWGIYSLAMGMNRHKLLQEGLLAIRDFIQRLQNSGYLEELPPAKQAALWEKWGHDLFTYASKYRAELSSLLLMLDEATLPNSFTLCLHRTVQWQDAVMDLNFMEGITWGINKAVQDCNSRSPVRRFWIDILKSSAQAQSVEQFMLNIAIRLTNMAYPHERLFG